MASIPPVVAEDQTDEEFFDKLVDDSFGIAESRSGSEDVAESDNAIKTSEDVGMCNAGTFFQGSDDLRLNSGGEGPSNNEIEQSSIATEKDVSALGEGTSLVTSNSFAFDDPETESGDPAPMTTDVTLVSSSTTSSGSRGAAIKEVEWSAFNSELAQPETGRSHSYMDFFNELADNSVNSFAEVGIESKVNSNTTDSFAGYLVSDSAKSSSLPGQQQSEYYGTVGEQIQDGQQLDGSQYWESLYPGWKFDAISGQWYQVDGYNVAETTQMDSLDMDQSESVGALDHRSQLSYLQQTTQSVAGAVVENCTTGCVSNWTQDSNGSIQYPLNMVFDPQYPGWYYDTIAQEWRLLESYTQTGAVQISTGNEQPAQDGNASLGGFSEKEHGLYTESNHLEQQNKSRDQCADWAGSGIDYAQSGMWQSEPVANGGTAMGFARSQQAEDLHNSLGHVDNCADQKMGFKKMESISFYAHADNSYDSHSGETGFQSLASAENLYHYSQQKVEECQQRHASSDYCGNQKSVKYDQQPIHTRITSNMHVPYVQNEARSSAGRPPHALVTFGFGGKLVVLKDSRSSYEEQGSAGGSISILNLIEVVADKMQTSSLDTDAYDYFRALCQQSFPGPVVGGNPATKELYKWIDERIANCQSPNMDSKKGELLRLLHSLLKICCQHYGKLRSPFGVDSALQESDSPELAVAKLFASAKKNGALLSNYGDISHCMQNLPTEGQIQTTAVEVENLLVSGRRKEALHCAQTGQLWGPALVLAAQLGEKFYVDTVKQMAHRQFVPGSPLRTLCLLIAGQPADVFSGHSSINASPFSPVELPQQPAQFLANGVLDDWEENLAIITANRTKDDELVIIHLGDCLWKERGQITAAHTCYLVAEANFESYSDTARLCLIGADHWKCPRTYVSPEAIQRTELYEYSKVLGNSQFILLPFQPYKLIYAHMLADVGKVSESLRYCQAILKTLKNSGRAPEVETWKSLLSSLEERIKTHQQGGYSANLAPAKLVGKLFNSIDRSIHRMIGTPPPLPSPTQSSSLNSEYDNQSDAKKVASSQSTMAMSSLVPSASMERISEWAGDNNRMTMHNRSMSEPDFSRSPKQVSPKKQAIPAGGKSSIAGGPSRFGRFGSQLLQKTMGWVSRSRQDRQAKLGEKNKFYYDEKLKRWVEEGAGPPTEEAALPPPPTTAPFQNSASEKSHSLPSNGMLESRSPNSSEHSKGLPPIPPSTNQFSARGRMGVRSRYVDTFNKNGGTNAKFFQSPPIQAAKPAGGAKFFVPTPSSSVDQTVDATGESIQDVATGEDSSASAANESSFSSISSTAPPLQRFPSMNNIAHITNKGVGVSGSGDDSAPYHSRAASWSGSYSDMFNTKANATKPLGKALGMPLSSFMMPSYPSPMQTVNGGSSGDDLHEVEL